MVEVGYCSDLPGDGCRPPALITCPRYLMEETPKMHLDCCSVNPASSNQDMTLSNFTMWSSLSTPVTQQSPLVAKQGSMLLNQRTLPEVSGLLPN